MSELERIEKAIQTLDREQLAAFQRWFDDFLAEQWDHALEKDIAAGRLDAVAEEAIRQHSAHRVG